MDTVSSSDLFRRVQAGELRQADLQRRLADLVADLAAKKLRLENIVQAQALIQTTAQETQSQLKYHIQALVQNALDAVFPTTYVFKVGFEPRRGQTEVDIYLDKDGEPIDPMDASGGGVVDVVTFALRVVAWSLSNTAPILILDEPMKWVSAGRRAVCGELLRAVSDRLGLQIIMVTHDPALVVQADRVFEVKQRARRSQVSVKQRGTE